MHIHRKFKDEKNEKNSTLVTLTLKLLQFLFFCSLKFRKINHDLLKWVTFLALSRAFFFQSCYFLRVSLANPPLSKSLAKRLLAEKRHVHLAKKRLIQLPSSAKGKYEWRSNIDVSTFRVLCSTFQFRYQQPFAL